MAARSTLKAQVFRICVNYMLLVKLRSALKVALAERTLSVHQI